MTDRVVLALVHVLVLGGAPALAGGRVLPFSPLEDARPGEKAVYRLDIFDASGNKVSSAEKSYAVDAHADGVVAIGRLELPEGADAAEILGALRLLPPGTPLDGLALKPEPVPLPGERKADGFKVSLRATLKDGATIVTFDAWFVKEVPVFGLVRSRTKIAGGGAGESVYELVEFKPGR